MYKKVLYPKDSKKLSLINNDCSQHSLSTNGILNLNYTTGFKHSDFI